MKNLVLVGIMMLAAQVSMAAPKSELKAECQAVVEEAAAKADTKMFGAEAGGCGSKLLHLGDQLETYLVCVSDETDPSEWIVTVQRHVSDKNGKIVKRCQVKYTGYAVDAATPDFE